VYKKENRNESRKEGARQECESEFVNEPHELALPFDQEKEEPVRAMSKIVR
jgi:hypothetical protein